MLIFLLVVKLPQFEEVLVPNSSSASTKKSVHQAVVYTCGSCSFQSLQTRIKTKYAHIGMYTVTCLAEIPQTSTEIKG